MADRKKPPKLTNYLLLLEEEVAIIDKEEAGVNARKD